MLKIFHNSEPQEKRQDSDDKYRRLYAAYQKQKAQIEALTAERARLKADLSAAMVELNRAVESSKKSVLKARNQQKNSKERAGRLSEKLKKLEGAAA